MARSKHHRRRGRLGLILGAAVVALAVGGAARADDISNNLDASIDSVAEVMPLTVDGASGTTSLYVQPTGGDGKSGCNLTGSTTLVLSIASSNTAVATVSPSSVTFTSCGSTPVLTVTPHGQGTATISASQTSNNTGATFNLAPVTFTANVAPPPNTPPQIAVNGVTGGASYDKGSVPAATCDVTDPEDGNSSFPATLSAVTGPYASDGIGSQTASCSYTDGGGLTAAASETYSIVDPSVPDIDYLLDPASPDGNNGWYTSDVSLSWTVGEPQSPSSLVKSGCLDQNVTSDQAATAYGCAATSAGGSAGPVSVTIKRDATPPTIAGSALPVPNLNGWNNSDVTVSFSCGDNLSGVASCAPAETLSAEAAGQSASGTAVDNAGNTAGASVGDVNIDKTAPGVVYTSASPDANASGWHNTDVVATFTATDTLSGFAGPSATATGTSTTSGEGAAVTVGSPAFTDLAGNTAAAGAATSAEFKVDKSPPSIANLSLKTADGSDYTPGTWTNQSVTATFSCADELSGPKAASVSTTLPNSGADQTASRVCEDNAGNQSDPAGYSDIDIDKVDPTIVASATKADGSPYTGGWTNQTVTVSFSCADALSGIAAGACPADVVVGSDTPSAGTDVSGSVSDRAGNSEASNEINVQVDKTDPTIVASATKADGSAYTGGWTNQTVTVGFSCADALSGVAAGACPADVVVGSDTVSAGTDVSASVSDHAGNSKVSNEINVKVDKTKPTIAAAVVPSSPDGSNGWYVTAPTVSFGCDDSLSGVAGCAVDGSNPASDQVTLGEDASAQTVGGTATDLAGNLQTASVDGLKVDLSNPVVQCGATPTFLAGSLGSVSASVSDSISGAAVGLVSAPATNPNGGAVSLTGYDNAGRSTAVSCPYHVVGATFLQPINGRPTVNLAKLGRVIPVKVQLLHDGVPQTDLNTAGGAVTIGVATTSCTFTTAVDDIEAYAAGASNTGLQFRWDSLGGFWIYNLDTSSFAMKASTCYQASVYLDGTKAGYFFVKITK